MKKEALFYKKTEDKCVECYLCNHFCRIKDGEFGFCGVRQNSGGTLYTHAYGRVIACAVDPVEKKPLYHFLPGSSTFSVATIGCNFRCGFCQNWQISQLSFRQPLKEKGESLSSEEIVESALRYRCRSISYTYTEPTIFFEYAFETARLARENGLYNIFVTNGFMTREPLKAIGPYLDAANVDLKFFKDDSYKRICAGSLEPVLESIRIMKELKIWVEITTLIVPGENDDEAQLKGIADFISGLDSEIPWHVSRFYPDFKFDSHPATSEDALRKALEIGKASGLKYIYAGNVRGWGNDTPCPGCKKMLIKREGFSVAEFNIKEDKCPYCQNAIAGVFSK